MAYNFVRKGYNVIFMDFPGFNKSTIGGSARAPPERWTRYGVDMVRQLLEHLKIPRVHFVCYEESANVFFDCLAKIPDLLAKTHVLVAPMLHNLETRWTPDVLNKLLLSTSVTLLVFEDEKTYGNQAKSVGI